MRRNIFAVGAILACLAVGPVLAGDEFRSGDWAVGATYAYASPDTDFNVRQSYIGLDAEAWLTDDFSLDFGVTVPKGDPGQDTASPYLQADYHFGPLYVPLAAVYQNDIDSLAVGSGVGFNFLGGPINLRFQATAYYLEDADLEDRTALQVTGAVRWKF